MKEYQSVMLAGLLHDIGKFTNRMKLEKGRHPKHSEIFVLSDQFKSLLKDDWVDIELVANLVRCHHEDPRIGSDFLVEAISDERTRALAYIVSRADNYSSSERISQEKDIHQYYKTVPLDSIFPSIIIDENRIIRKLPLRYRAKPLSVQSIFPQEFDHLSENEIDALVNAFGREVSRLKTTNFPHFYQGLMSLLEKYTWCIPSDTTSQMRDISLYDHLKTTSAISTCLYQYHKDQLNEKEIKNNYQKKFLLIGGDLSGIQNYIYRITGSDSTGKGVSKRLRARSFYLNLLVEVGIHRILHYLNLPLSCILMAAGGRFILLAPNLEHVKESLHTLSLEFNQWFIKEFRGELSLNLTWDCEMSGEDFQDLSNLLEQLNDALENKKKHKYYEVIYSNSQKKWEPKNFIFDSDYGHYSQFGECNSCHMFPAKDNNKLCRYCQKDSQIGSDLPGSNYLLFRKGPCRNYTLSFLKDDSYSVEMVKSKNSIPDISADRDVYLIKRIIPVSEKTKEDLDNPGFVDDYLLNTVPYFSDNKAKEYICQGCNQKNQCEEENKKVTANNIPYTFSCLAATSSWLDEQGVQRGEQLIGVLKADLDWLGLIFRTGLKNQMVKLTVSRYATLSRMLNYFFLGWIKNELTELKNGNTSFQDHHRNADFTKIYGVYSGGDDLLLIGPWETIILFAYHLYRNFREYTGQNDNITLSAGIAITKPRFPLYRAVAIANKYLEKSKEFGKNRITLFDTTITWQEFEKLKSFKDTLCQELDNKQSKLNLSFLYRLFRYHEMYLSFYHEQKVEGLKFHSHLASDVARNIDSKSANQNFRQELEKLYSIVKFDEELMKNLKIPLFWTIYKFRKNVKKRKED